MENRITIPDYVVNTKSPVLTLSENLTWSLTDYHIPDLHDKGYTGQGVKVAILDTGIVDHSDLKPVHVEDMTGTGTTDDHGHGTHVAGIVAALRNEEGVRGIAPDAELYIFKVISSSSGSIEHVIKGIDRAVELGCKIINMSLGSGADVPALKAACVRAKNAGVLLICASGNSGNQNISFPGSYDACVAVGSVNKEKSVSAFTSFGQPLDVMAPGEKILSTYLNNGYAILSGTSMAAPWISGICALLVSAGIDVDYELLIGSTTDINDPGFDKKSGYGIFDPYAALKNSDVCELSTSHKVTKQLDTIYSALEEIKKLCIDHKNTES